MPIVAASIGVGSFAKSLGRLGRPYLPFEQLLTVEPQAGERASHCVPAAALALLASSDTAGTQRASIAVSR